MRPVGCVPVWPGPPGDSAPSAPRPVVRPGFPPGIPGGACWDGAVGRWFVWRKEYLPASLGRP
eukprot:1924094-Alexandrium_andersonii.AAC.1